MHFSARYRSESLDVHTAERLLVGVAAEIIQHRRRLQDEEAPLPLVVLA